jgi:ParB-like chromosome segregation protein Spo0J
VSEKLLDMYAEDGMSLEQLMAFTVTIDRSRQEQVWEALQRSYSQEPYQIRRMLTERTVRASDRRALFVGLEAYEQACSIVMRDLIRQDVREGFQSPARPGCRSDRRGRPPGHLSVERRRGRRLLVDAENWSSC